VGVEEEEDGPQLPLDITMPPRVSQNLVHTADKILVCKVRAEHINKQFNVPGALTQPSPAAVAELQALGIWRYLVVNDVLDGSDGVGTPNRVLLVQTIPMAEDASRLFGWVFWAFINRKDWDPATYLRGCIEGHGEYVARTLKYLKETKFLTGQMVVVEPMFDIATTTKVSAVAQWNMQSSEAGRQAQIVGHRPEAIESRTALDPSVFLGLEYLGNHMGGGDPLALDPAEYVDQATGCFSFPRRTRPYLTLLTDLAALRNPVLFFNTRLPGLPNRDLRPPSSVEVRAMRGLRAARSRCEPGAESMEDVKRQVFAASLHRMIETTEGQLAKIEGAAVAAAQILSAVDEEALALMNKHGGRYVVRMSGMRPEIRRAASRGRFTIDALRSDPRLWGGFTRLHALLACSARKRAWTVVSDYVSATAHLPPAIKSCAEHVDQLLESDAHTLFAHKPRRANGPLVTGLEDLWGLWFYAKKVQNVHRNFRAGRAHRAVLAGQVRAGQDLCGGQGAGAVPAQGRAAVLAHVRKVLRGGGGHVGLRHDQRRGAAGQDLERREGRRLRQHPGHCPGEGDHLQGRVQVDAPQDGGGRQSHARGHGGQDAGHARPELERARAHARPGHQGQDHVHYDRDA
jgi:hypothetical protein